MPKMRIHLIRIKSAEHLIILLVHLTVLIHFSALSLT